MTRITEPNTASGFLHRRDAAWRIDSSGGAATIAPAFGSAFLAALAEIRHFSDSRTPERLAIAQYWAGTTGSLVAGLWNSKVSDAVAGHDLGEVQAARVLMLTNDAAMDAQIACHDAKCTYWFIRPFYADPAITPRHRAARERPGARH